jgi:glycosyltransferase involved in cell wall biosynthesis
VAELLSVPDKLALVYQPNSYVRRGPPETCVQMIAQNQSAGFKTELMVVRARVPLPTGLASREALPRFLNRVPWNAVRGIGIKRLDRQFIRRLRQLDPANTIVDVWPGWPSPIIPEARRLGFTIVRTMINSACALSKDILDQAYQRHGLPPTHDVTDKLVRAETDELRQYDYIFSPSAEVDRSLALIGIPESRVIRSSFGWNPARFAASVPEAKPEGRLRFLFVGSVGVRKGVPELLEAWRGAALPNAELLIIGNVEPAYAEEFKAKLPAGVTHMPFSMNIGGFYKSADVFVFPSLEEGAPQVVYEAAGCGAAILTTPMGQARMIEPDVNGLVVPPADVDALADAMRRLATEPALLARLKAAAVESAKDFEYPVVAERRAAMLAALLERRTANERVAASA